MKRVITLLVCALLILPAFAPFGLQAKAEVTSNKFMVWSKIAQSPGLYAYSKESSSGSPVATFPVGSIVTVSNWYTNSEYCYASSYYGSGYVWKGCMLAQFDYNDPSFPAYSVNSTNLTWGKYILYM